MTTATLNHKVCLLGDFAVGKTSLVRRYVYERFEDKYLSTIGVKVSRKTIVIAQQRRLIHLSMILWDLAGSEEFDQLRSSYLRGASGAVLVCDLTRPQTLQHMNSYLEDLYRVSSSAQVILAANKCDLVNQQALTAADIESFAVNLNLPYQVTSAKTGEGVENIFRQLGHMLIHA